MQIIPINILAFSSLFIFFVLKVPNGVANTPEIVRMNGSKKLIGPFSMVYIIKPTIDIANSAVIATPIDSFVFRPEITCPAVTIGPNPPPERDLLNALNIPNNSKVPGVYLNFFLTSNINPIIKTKRDV